MHESSDCPKLLSNKGRAGPKRYVAFLLKPSKLFDDEAINNSDSDLYDSVESFKIKRSRRKSTKKRVSFAKNLKAHNEPSSDE